MTLSNLPSFLLYLWSNLLSPHPPKKKNIIKFYLPLRLLGGLHSETEDETMQLKGGRDRTEGRSGTRLGDSDRIWRVMGLDSVLGPGRRRSSVVVQPCAPATPASLQVPLLLVSAAALPLKG